MPQFAHLKRYPYLIAAWIFITCLCGIEHFGLNFLFIGPPCFLYAVTRYILQRHTEQARSKYFFLICVILMSSTLVLGIHLWHAYAARHYANDIAEKLEQHKQIYGTLPAHLEEIPELKNNKKQTHMLHYHLLADGPLLIYSSTLSPFMVWRYDFNKKYWVNEHH